MTFTPEATGSGRQLAGTDRDRQLTGPFTFYEVADSALVEAATSNPPFTKAPTTACPARLGGVVGIGPGRTGATFEEVSLEWYGWMDLLDRWITTDGPADWPRITIVDQLGAGLLRCG